LVLSLLLAGKKDWPNNRFKAIALITMVLGLGYTIYSEWHNTTVTQSWAYSEAMPRIWGIGLAPVAQWLFIPGFVFWWIHRRNLRCDADPSTQFPE
jgi:disulfide bond formation protein DsbB